MQTIYFNIIYFLIEVLAVNNDHMQHMDPTWIPFLIQMSPFCFYSKNWVGVQNDSSWKTATTIWLYDVPRNFVEG